MPRNIHFQKWSLKLNNKQIMLMLYEVWFQDLEDISYSHFYNGDF